VKQVSFKTEAKKWWGRGWGEWWINRGRRCDKRKNVSES